MVGPSISGYGRAARALTPPLAMALIAGIGALDHFTGVEVRIYPLYFLPLAASAWGRRTRVALLLATFCAAVWLFSNLDLSLRGLPPVTWAVNAAAQWVAFAVVAGLISMLSRSLTRERELARTDGLTGLLNSRAFMASARHELERCQRFERPVTMAYLDLDNFKTVNDTLGHQAGSDLLCAVADAMRHNSRTIDVVARLGGDEFGVLMPETDRSAAAAALGRLQRAIVAVLPQDLGPEITVSIGAAACVPPLPEVGTLIGAADQAMYDAKHSGKNRIQFFAGELGATPLALLHGAGVTRSASHPPDAAGPPSTPDRASPGGR